MKQEERVAKDIPTNKKQKLNDAKTNKEREREEWFKGNSYNSYR